MKRTNHRDAEGTEKELNINFFFGFFFIKNFSSVFSVPLR